MTSVELLKLSDSFSERQIGRYSPAVLSAHDRMRPWIREAIKDPAHAYVAFDWWRRTKLRELEKTFEKYRGSISVAWYVECYYVALYGSAELSEAITKVFREVEDGRSRQLGFARVLVELSSPPDSMLKRVAMDVLIQELSDLFGGNHWDWS